MGTHKNTIVINGKLYDTTTGKPVASHPSNYKNFNQENIIHPESKSTTNDQDEFKITVRTKANSIEDRHMRHDGVRAHNIHHKTDQPKTLMRSAVNNPKDKPLISRVIPQADQPKHTIFRHGNIDRELRASINLKSKRISRFEPNQAKVNQRTEHVPVKIAPKEFEEEKIYVTKQAPPIDFNKYTDQENKALTTSNLFEQALLNSTSHKQKSPKKILSKKNHKASRQIIKIASSLTAFILITGAILYHNQTGYAVRQASVKAGFAASLPEYKPIGFKLEKNVQSNYGAVTLRYISNTSQDQFEINQTRSDIDESILESSLENSIDKYVTYSGNQKILIYNGSNAKWLKNGVLYSLQGNVSLSAQQITNIVDSL